MQPYIQMALAIMAFILFEGCHRENVSTTGGGKLFVISFQTLRNPFFVELNDSLRTAIEANGDRLVTLDAQYDTFKQRNDVVELLQQHPALIFINPVNWEGIKSTLIEAKRANVPVIVVDAPVSDPDLVFCQVASDNFEAGRLACEALARIKPAANVVIIQHSVNKAAIDRVGGFRAEMARHSGMTLLDTQEGKGSADGAQRAMSELLTRFPQLNAVFPINDPSALGSIAAIEASGRAGKVTVVSVDGSRQGAVAILAGKLYASVAQYPRQIGILAAENAYAYLVGKQARTDVMVPVKLITLENAVDLLKEKQK